MKYSCLMFFSVKLYDSGIALKLSIPLLTIARFAYVESL